MKGILKLITATALPLWFGAALVIYATAFIDVSVRVNYWTSRGEYPNVDPRIIYTFAMLAMFVAAFLSGVVELLRQWVFERKSLYWWQLAAVGAAYPIIFSSTALRHAVGYQTAELLSVTAAILLNPFFVYWKFHGYEQAKSA